MKTKKIIIIVILVLAVFLFNNGVRAETDILYGDVDDSGDIDIIDATLIYRYLDDMIDLDHDAQIRADVDGDNKITRNDGILIQRYLAYMISFPVRMGDLNDDNIIDSADIQILQTGIDDPSTLTRNQKLLGDLNVDGAINDDDLVLMQDFIGGSISSLPAIEGKPIESDEEVEPEEESDTQEEAVIENNPETGNIIYIYIIGFTLICGISLLITYGYHRKQMNIN